MRAGMEWQRLTSSHALQTGRIEPRLAGFVARFEEHLQAAIADYWALDSETEALNAYVAKRRIPVMVNPVSHGMRNATESGSGSGSESGSGSGSGKPPVPLFLHGSVPEPMPLVKFADQTRKSNPLEPAETFLRRGGGLVLATDVAGVTDGVDMTQ